MKNKCNWKSLNPLPFILCPKHKNDIAHRLLISQPCEMLRTDGRNAIKIHPVCSVLCFSLHFCWVKTLQRLDWICRGRLEADATRTLIPDRLESCIMNENIFNIWWTQNISYILRLAIISHFIFLLLNVFLLCLCK